MKFKFIGIGAAGNKAAITLVQNNICTEDDVVLINSTTKDIPQSFKGKVVILTADNTGAGKERHIANDYAIAAIKSGLIDSAFEDDKSDSILIITSVEGGTGSGSTPIIAKYLYKSLGYDVHICAFTGFEDDVRGIENTVEFFKEIDFECDVQVIRNAAFLDQARGNSLRAEELANEELCQRVEILTGQNLIVSSQNIDDTDIYKVMSTCGYKTIEKICFTEDLMDTEQFNKLCKQIIYRSKSLKTDHSSQRIGIILNIKPESEDAIDYSFKAIIDEYGMPFERFFHKQYDGGKQYIAFIISGMKMPLDEVKAIHQRYLDQTQKVNKEADAFISELSSLQKDQRDNLFDMGRIPKRRLVNKDDFFKE